MPDALSELSRSVEGRVVLITGAASGMGRAMSHLFADVGARVGMVDRTGDGIGIVSEELERAGHEAGSFAGFAADVGNPEEITSAVAAIRDALGPIDILVNNAGVSIAAPIASEDYDEAWATTLRVNLQAHTRLIRECLTDLQRNRDGRIINIASTEGLGATPYLSPYTASKHGVIGLTKALAVELGRTGVTVNCVAPGPIRTGMTASIDEENKAKFARRRVPVGRYGEPEEIAHAVLSLALPASSFINGSVLVVDGGMIAQNI